MDAIQKERAKGPTGDHLPEKKEYKVSQKRPLPKYMEKKICMNHRLYDLSLSIHFDLMSL